MDFIALPPEINSARMYAGPGSAPMREAAEAWQSLATELYSTANSYQSVVSGLTTGPWLGPSSTTMAAATSYETAFAATVPPPLIAANRALLSQLLATNVFGQNTSAIATTEAQYA